jgi:GTP cyclohydrolase II
MEKSNILTDYPIDTNYEDKVYESLSQIASARMPTKFGNFTLAGFHDREEDEEFTVLIRGDLDGKENCPVRIHSQCYTGDVLGSLRCDCREQLESSLGFLGKKPFGLLIYLMQEGRGIGLMNKLKAYHLQDGGLDTIEANEHLGLPVDGRNYKTAAKVIRYLGIYSIRLLTNNPEKIQGLEEEGVKVNARIPLIIPANSYNEYYLSTKKDRMGHLL